MGIATARDRFSALAAASAALMALAGLFFCILHDVTSYDFYQKDMLLVIALMALLLATAAGGIAVGRHLASPAHVSPAPGKEDQTARRLASVLQIMEETAQELRNPVNTILGFSEILAAPATASLGEQERDSYRQFILDGSKTLAGFVPQLLDFARYERNRLHLVEQDVDAAELAEAAMTLCRHIAESRDVVIVARLLDGIELHCDADRIRRALACLITRALTGALLGSKVVLDFTRELDDSLGIVITDLGKGPSADESPHLFDPSLGHEGLSGLGLAVAKRVLLLHSGDVTIARAPGAGTITRIVFPASRVTWPQGGTETNNAP